MAVFQKLDAGAAVLRVDGLQVTVFQDAGQCEDVAQIVVDNQHLAAGQHGIGFADLIQRLLLFDTQDAQRPMQQKHGFIQQALNGGGVADRAGAGAAVNRRDLLVRQFAGAGDHHRWNRQS